MALDFQPIDKCDKVPFEDVPINGVFYINKELGALCKIMSNFYIQIGKSGSYYMKSKENVYQ